MGLHLIRQALSMPLGVVLGKAWAMGRRKLKHHLTGRLMRRMCTYPVPLSPVLRPLDPGAVAGDWTGAAQDILDHRFDLLGSGPVQVRHGQGYAGFGGHRYGPGPSLGADWRDRLAAQASPGNQIQSRALLRRIADPAYQPVDWQVDFRSGYRWPVQVWGPAAAYGHRPGVDIKLPWELARLQHLPALALAYAQSRDAALVGEFMYQVLDFLGSNPPGWGVNWACAMDVGIRAANVCLALDLFAGSGAGLDQDFLDEVGAALLAHGRHIVHHLEYSPEHRGNHYLANLCGLAFIAAHLPRSQESDLWLVFAAQQLDQEILRQFGPDGGGFEASIPYHRLSAEMALWSTALILGLDHDRRLAFAQYDAAAWGLSPKIAPGPMAWPPLSAAALDRLGLVGRFMQDVTGPDGLAIQVGDNDSGRFFRLDQDAALDFSGTLRAFQGIYDLNQAVDHQTRLIAGLSGGARRPVASDRCRILAAPWPTGPQAQRAVRLTFPRQGDAALTPLAFPQFGLFLWKAEKDLIAVRCGPIGLNGLGAHGHNDALAVELILDGRIFAKDPGSFVYTADLAARNRYRGALAHFVPRQESQEPARLDLGPFRLEDRALAQALLFRDGEFLGCHQGFGQPVWRHVQVDGSAVTVTDLYGGPVLGHETAQTGHVIDDPAQLARLWGLCVPFSQGYGMAEKS